MRIEVNRESLEKILQVSNSVAASKNVLPILENNLFKFSAQRLELVSSNLELSLVVGTEYELVEGEVKDFIADGQSILKVISLLKAEKIFIEVEFDKKGKGKLSFGTTKTRKKYDLPISYAASEFPTLDTNGYTTNSCKLPGNIVSQSGRITSPFCNPADLRPSFQGVQIGVSVGKYQAMVTNGSVLATTEYPVEESDSLTPVVITQNTCRLLNVYDKSPEVVVSVSDDKKKVMFSDNGVTIYSSLIDCQFPDIQNVFSKIDNTSYFVSNRSELINSIKRSLVMANAKSSIIKLDFTNPTLVLSAEDVDWSKSSLEELELKEKTENVNFVAGLNGQWLLNFASSLEAENIISYCSGSEKAFMFTDDRNGGLSVKYLVMPIRLKQK